MTTFVLIHGGGHGGWCWRSCANALRSRGHEAYAPTLTGFGDRSHLVAESFETFVTDIVSTIEFEDLRDVVLVGHSMGGVVVPRVAEAVPDRVSAAVWLTAAVCSDGESLLQTIPQSPERLPRARAADRLRRGELDRTIEPAVQEQLAARLPGCRRASVAAGHDCMVTQPEATADALIAVSSG